MFLAFLLLIKYTITFYAKKLYQNSLAKFNPKQGIFCYKYIWTCNRAHL